MCYVVVGTSTSTSTSSSIVIVDSSSTRSSSLSTAILRTEHFAFFSPYKKWHTGHIKINSKILFLYGEAKKKVCKMLIFCFSNFYFSR